MENFQHFMPGYAIDDYMITVMLPTSLKKSVQKLQPVLPAHTMVKTPQIIIARFSALAMRKERLLQRLRWLCMGTQVMAMQANGFSVNEYTGAQLEILPSKTITGFVENLEKQTKKLCLHTDEHKSRYYKNPHASITRKLNQQEMIVAEKSLLSKRCSSSFVAGVVSIWQKKAGAGSYAIIAQLPLENMPVNVTQGVLF